jgi:hypothetical protein
VGARDAPPVSAWVWSEDQAAVACLHAFLSDKNWVAGAQALTTKLNGLLQGHRVSLSWLSGHALRLRALSDGQALDEGVALDELLQAMQEAVAGQRCLAWPAVKEDAAALPTGAACAAASSDGGRAPDAPAHQALFRVQGLSGLITVPLMLDGVVLGALSCERSEHHDPLRPLAPLHMPAGLGFSAQERTWLLHLADLLAPAMRLRYRLEMPWYERWLGWAEALRLRLSDPRERALRCAVLAFFGALSFGMGLPLPYQLTASAHLEGAAQHVLSAPHDGFLSELRVRPGDEVKSGQLLLAMADDAYQLTRKGLLAEISQHEQALTQARAQGLSTQVLVAQARLAQAQASLAMTDEEIIRSQIRASFDGVVIAGDLAERMDVPFKRGERLLTLAPGLDWRVVLDVDEADIAALSKGQMAQLRLGAMPEQTIGLILSRVTPIAKSTPWGPRYEVEALPTGAGAGARGLRPGLQGVVRIDMSPKPLLWRAADRGWQWLRQLAWNWL